MVRYVLIGAGARGKDAYGRWIARNGARARLVAVVEPREARREECAGTHGIPATMQFTDWSEMLARAPMADACIVATQDRDHAEPALAAIAAGYHILLEKPMAVTEEDCRRLVSESEKAGVLLRICHVLRSTAFFGKIKTALDEGRLGTVAAIRHSENVSSWHYAHSYVRGNWRTAEGSSPMILAKSCHDIDLLCWLAGSRPRAVHSFGSQVFFNEKNAPVGAPQRCTDGCPHEKQCPWFAPRMYVHGAPMLKDLSGSRNPFIRLLAGAFATDHLNRFWRWKEWPTSTVSDDLSPNGILAALRNGPYGRCVFRCDNDVVDRQVVNLEFESGVVASFTLHGHSAHEGRQIRIDGSAGSLEGSFGFAGEKLEFFDHRRGGTRTVWQQSNPFAGHGGGDDGLMERFTADVERRLHVGAAAESESSARAALVSHLVCFAAERSRRESRVIRLEKEGGVV